MARRRTPLKFDTNVSNAQGSVRMKKCISPVGIASCLFLTAQSSIAAITSSDSSLTLNSGNIVWSCKVTQTTGAPDHLAYPDGKAISCYMNDTGVGSNWCSTNYSTTHTCTVGATYGPAYAGTYTFTAQAYGGNGGWVPTQLTTRGLGCIYDGVCIPF